MFGESDRIEYITYFLVYGISLLLILNSRTSFLYFISNQVNRAYRRRTRRSGEEFMKEVSYIYRLHYIMYRCLYITKLSWRYRAGIALRSIIRRKLVKARANLLKAIYRLGLMACPRRVQPGHCIAINSTMTYLLFIRIRFS